MFDKLTLPKFEDKILHIEDSELLLPQTDNEICKIMSCKFAYCWNNPIPLDAEYLECFLNHSSLSAMENPITMLNIQQYQFADDSLNECQQKKPYRYPVKMIQDRTVICIKANEDCIATEVSGTGNTMVSFSSWALWIDSIV